MLCGCLVLPAAQLCCVTAWSCLQVAARQLASCKNQPLLTALLGVISTLCGPDLSGSHATAVREALLGARPPLLASLLNQVEDHGTSTPLRAAALGELVVNWRTWWPAGKASFCCFTCCCQLRTLSMLALLECDEPHSDVRGRRKQEPGTTLSPQNLEQQQLWYGTHVTSAHAACTKGAYTYIHMYTYIYICCHSCPSINAIGPSL